MIWYIIKGKQESLKETQEGMGFHLNFHIIDCNSRLEFGFSFSLSLVKIVFGKFAIKEAVTSCANYFLCVIYDFILNVNPSSFQVRHTNYFTIWSHGVSCYHSNHLRSISLYEVPSMPIALQSKFFGEYGKSFRTAIFYLNFRCTCTFVLPFLGALEGKQTIFCQFHASSPQFSVHYSSLPLVGHLI